jgi:hypothetical protein
VVVVVKSAWEGVEMRGGEELWLVSGSKRDKIDQNETGTKVVNFSPVVSVGLSKKKHPSKQTGNIETSRIFAVLSLESSLVSVRPPERGTTRPIPILKCVNHNWSSASGLGC